MGLFRSHPVFRPPGEADSLILRVADGCPWNACAFCGMYKGVPYRFSGLEAAEREIAAAARRWPDATRVFLADGDVMHLEADTLMILLQMLGARFPRLARVSLYAGGSSILAKSDEELLRLRELRLHTLYMGLESGDPVTLRAVCKRESAGEMTAACQRAQAAGLRLSVMVLIGLAGRSRSLEHARATAAALNAMQPRLLSALRLVTVPGTPMHSSGFKMISEYDAVAELRELISVLRLEQTVFRADHSSNIVPLEGRFPKDRQRLLDQLDRLMGSGRLDRKTPGALPWSL